MSKAINFFLSLKPAFKIRTALNSLIQKQDNISLQMKEFIVNTALQNTLKYTNEYNTIDDIMTKSINIGYNIALKNSQKLPDIVMQLFIKSSISDFVKNYKSPQS